MYKYVLLAHILGATVWTGGHLVLAARILPEVLRRRSASMLLDFEKRYELLGMSALACRLRLACGSRRASFRSTCGCRSEIHIREW